MLFDRDKVIVKWVNERSYINRNYLMTPGTGVVGIYGIDDSRFIYIELDCLSKRTFVLYEIHFNKNYFNGLSSINLGIWKKTSAHSAVHCS